MSAQGAWARPDASAPPPVTAAPVAPARSTPALRLRRSSSPVVAALDGGGAILRRRLRDVLVGSGVIMVPAVAADVWLGVEIRRRADGGGSVADASADGLDDLAAWVAITSAGLVAAAVGHLVAQLLLGERFRRPVTLGAALARTARSTPAIVVAWLLTHWWFPLLALAVVAADDDARAGLIALSAFVGWFASAAAVLVVPAMVDERLGPFAAVARGWRLARRRYGACLLLVALSALLGSLLVAGMASLVPSLEALGFLHLGGASAVVQQVVVQLAVLLVVPLVALGTAQAHVELRVLVEGLDLSLEADAAFGPRPADEAAPFAARARTR